MKGHHKRASNPPEEPKVEEPVSVIEPEQVPEPEQQPEPEIPV